MHLGCSSCEWWVLWVLCPSDGLKRQLKIHLDLGGFSIAMFHYLPGIYHGHKPQLAYKVKGLGYYLRGGNNDSWAGYLGLSTIKVSRLVKVNHKIRFGMLCMMNWEYTSHIIKGFWMMVIDVYDVFFRMVMMVKPFSMRFKPWVKQRCDTDAQTPTFEVTTSHAFGSGPLLKLQYI